MSAPRFLDFLTVTPMADGFQWRLNSRFRFWSAELGRMFEAPAMLIVDFASVPRFLWATLPPWSRYGAAATAHDSAYWQQDCTRAEADVMLREAMEVLGVDEITVNAIYTAVRTFGQSAWDRNAELKASGYTKLASPNVTPPYASAA